ncbi:hypothetical protein DFO70_11155 [Cytobacillus firmus]|uniref:DUF4352 domain-containing protein n=2 Tax=Cytobacillus TaxID=2675230 RepID=A0A366JPQ4_CYTFI|nr:MULTISPECIES: hypothetical protein [Cytobacillus]RBP89408.1 hypothetical protein DFO70_11155 [Cytobacillus firmus]TDX47365.1 hypothetical protein DFO72_101462 [Cytobacillus oceanisediminis]
MKNLFIFGVVALIIGLLTACGGVEQVEKKEPVKEETKKEDQNPVPNKEENEDVQKTEAGTFTAVHTFEKETKIDTESPFELTIKKVKAFSGELSETGKELIPEANGDMVIITMSVENTSDETLSFYPDQSTITTSTGEQLESEVFFSDDVGGDFIGQVKKEGTVRFLLKSTKAEDIEWVRILIDAPHNENLDNIGKSVDHTFTF